MSRAAETWDAPTLAPPRPGWTADGLLLRTFTGVRDELVSTLWFVLGNQEDAQDTAQEAFLRCWRARDALPDVRNLRAWIFRVGLNAARDLQRSARRRHFKPLPREDVLPAHPVPLGDDLDKEALRQVRQALVALRPEEKEVFLLRQNGERTFGRIAEQCHRPVGTIKTPMRGALHKLRRSLAGAAREAKPRAAEVPPAAAAAGPPARRRTAALRPSRKGRARVHL
jgi:RNA polymerase sigma-70 factor, ECF subfamily